ncbi:hypothetical protein GQ55_7G103600 [Panicum hallii var. hallii]|uniref:Endonuclease/exonuclease/phosphatase domain-containing protein n=1 Tax=Panicum hallii var. hallii TaxID=1504633 RepID=A0A2T7CTR4_9POAL|nr:hypothetical protein GQ55_7G103600 [Panicum hallii var. hallii]
MSRRWKTPDILFLSRRWRLGMTNLVVKNCEGQSGGLAILWKKEINFHLRAVSRLYLDGDVTEQDGFVWRFTSFYGEPRTDKKELSWKALRVLNAARRHPWLCMGDFNEILVGHEKEGGMPRPQVCMDQFRQALEECSLVDLGFAAVADVAWRALFPNFSVRNGDPRHSDHRPVIVIVEEEMNAWRLSMNTGTGVVSDAVRGVASDLWDWSRNILGDLEKRIKHVKRELEGCRRRALSSDVVARAQILWYKLEKLEEQRDMYWRQRRKVHWLQYGDQNMNFVHRYAFERRRQSRINKLVKEDGDAVTDVAE